MRSYNTRKQQIDAFQIKFMPAVHAVFLVSTRDSKNPPFSPFLILFSKWCDK